MTTIARYEKQPADNQDFDVDFTEWLAALNDTAPGPTGMTVVAQTGITVIATNLHNGVAKVWIGGGTSGTVYKVTVTITTTGNRVKQAEIKIKVKET